MESDNKSTQIRVRIESGCENVAEYRITDEELQVHNRLLRERLVKSGNLTQQEIDELFTLLEGIGSGESGQDTAVNRWIAAKVAAGKLQRMSQNCQFVADQNDRTGAADALGHCRSENAG